MQLEQTSIDVTIDEQPFTLKQCLSCGRQNAKSSQHETKTRYTVVHSQNHREYIQSAAHRTQS